MIEGFKLVKDYAAEKKTSLQAVYQKAKRGNLEVKKIGNLILVRDKS